MRNLLLALVVSPLAFVLLVEGLLHGLYFAGAFPDFPNLYTQQEKYDYATVAKVVYEDNVPRLSAGFSTYPQRGIPRQLIRSNDSGQRIDEFDGPAQCSVGVFGDSFSAAQQVGQFEDYSSLTETSLRSNGIDVDLMNFGMNAAGTTVQYLRYLQLISQGYKFDHIVLQFYPGNDTLNNHYELHRKLKRNMRYPYFVIQDGHLVRDDHAGTPKSKDALSGLKTFLKHYSHLVSLGLRTWGSMSATLERKWQFETFMPPIDQNWKEAWAVTDLVLEKWMKHASANGSKFTVVMITSALQFSEEISLEPRAETDYPNRRIGAIVARNHGAYLDLLPPAFEFIKRENLKHPYLSWEYDGHYSQLGHQFMADNLAPFMEANMPECRSDDGPEGR
jgi:hypothetical protein